MSVLAAKGLETRYVTVVSLGLLFFSIVAGIVTYGYAYRHELKSGASQQRQLIRSLQEQAEVAAYAANTQIAQGVLNALIANPIILAARIESREGFKGEMVSRQSANFDTGKIYPLFSPVNHIERIGTLVVVENDVEINAVATRAAMYLTSLMLAQAFVGAIIMAIVLRNMMINPIVRLAEAMGKIEPGSTMRLKVEGNRKSDEIGLLANSANELLDAAECAIRNERSLRRTLETTGQIARVGGWSLETGSLALQWTEETYRLHELAPTVPIDLDRAIEFYAPATRSVIRAAVQGAIENGLAFDLELPLTTALGNQRWMRAQGKVEQCEGRTTQVYGALQDITERKLAEDEVIAAKQAAENASLSKSRFLAAASHDLRQPVQAINLFRDALDRTELNDEQKRICDYLSLSTQSLGDILNALLDISKLDAGVVKPHLEEIQSDALFRYIDSEFAPLATAKSLRFKLHFPQREMTVLADAKLLQSLLRNLIGNAIKYTEKGGILVGIRRRGNHAVIQVWDTGIGIALEHTSIIFDEYFQIGNPERDRAKGLGLGLSIARRLAKLLETEIVCRSRPGKGSVFEFSLRFSDKPRDEAPSYIAQKKPGAAQ